MKRWAILIPLLLLLLKPLALCFEGNPFRSVGATATQQLAGGLGQQAAEQKVASEPLGGPVAYLGLGTLRRLDDASFWMALGCVIAAGRVLKLAGDPLRTRSKAARVCAILCSSYAAAWTILYVWTVAQLGESLAWPWKHWAPSAWRFWGSALVQVTEGLMIIASIGLVCVAADRAFRLAEHAAPPSADRPLPDTMADADLASDLLTACLSSFPLVLIGVAVFKVVTADFGFAAEAPLVFAIKVVGQSATAAVPLVAAAFAALWLWGSGRKYRIDVGADLVSIRVD